MADKIKQAVGVDSKLVKGGGGILDVVLDGRRIFSKHEVGRFPEDHEIIGPVKEAART